MIEEIIEYFDQRADADQPAGDAVPTPNEEMRLLMLAKEIEAVLSYYGNEWEYWQDNETVNGVEGWAPSEQMCLDAGKKARDLIGQATQPVSDRVGMSTEKKIMNAIADALDELPIADVRRATHAVMQEVIK